MHLGALLSRLENERDIPAFLSEIGDVMLLRRVETTAAAFEETPEEYIAFAVRRYAGQADSESWLQMMTAMEKADDPARAAIGAIVGWALRTDQTELAGASRAACGCGGH